jgi:diguanylate cyclase (GGDEF)-like protein
MEYAPYTSLWYLPAGLSMAAFIVLGKRALLPIFLSASIIDPGLRNALTNSFDITELVTGLLFGLVHTSAYTIGGSLARYYFFRLNQGDFPRKTIAILVAYGIGSGLAACSGIAVLLFVERPIMYQPLEGIIVWWLGDLIGCLVFTPLAVIVLSHIWPQYSPPINALVRLQYPAWNNIVRYSAKFLLVCLFVVLVMTTDAMMNLIEIPFFMFFLGVPLIWIIYTEHPYHSVLTLLVISLVMVFCLLSLELYQHAIIYQFALCITAINAYLAMSVPRLMQQNQLLSNITMTDLLTGLASQLRLITIADGLLQHADHKATPNILMTITIDNIQAINDSYGRAIGDHVLIRTAEVLRTYSPNSAIIARADSEAFLLLLLNTERKTAESLTKTLKQVLPKINHKGFEMPLRSSFRVIDVNCSEPFHQTLSKAITSAPIASSSA